MTNGLPVLPLGEFLKQRKEFFIIDDFSGYKRARVQSHGQGIILRDEVSGTEIKTKKQQAARTGEFLVAEIDAKVGGFGIVPPELDGAVVSSHYFLFQIDEMKCSKEWLNWFVRYNSLEEQTKAQGSTNYAAIRPNDVLNFEIPLPPLTEQRRIVEDIESLAARVNEAQRLREEADVEVDFLVKSYLSKIFDYEHSDKLPQGWAWKSFNETLMPGGMRTGPFGTALNKSEIFSEGVPVFGIPNVGVNEFRKGFTDFVTPEKAKSLAGYELNEGDIAVARSGTVGRSCVVPKGLNPKPIMSSNLIRIRINEKVFLPELMCRILNGSKLVENHIDKECRGSTRIFFTQKILGKFQIPTPPLDEQRRIVAYLDGLQGKVNALRELQSKTQEELDALLPSVLDKAFRGEL